MNFGMQKQNSDKTVIQKDTCTAMFITALFIVATHGDNLNVHWTEKWIKKM